MLRYGGFFNHLRSCRVHAKDCQYAFGNWNRYLRATKWVSANVAIERLEGTLKWRREYGVYDLTADMVEPEVSEFSVSGLLRFFTHFRFAHATYHTLFFLCGVWKRPSRESRSSLVMTCFAGPLCT